MDIDKEDRQSLGFLFDLLQRGGAGQQDHQVGMLHPADPDLLSVDHIAVALANGRRGDLGGVRAGGRLGHAHRLKPQLSACNLRQIEALLLFRAVPDQRVHIVHLAVAGAGIAAGAVDLFHDHARRRQRQAGAAIFLGDQGRHPAGLGQRGDECLGIGAVMVDFPVIFVRKLGTDGTDAFADVIELVWVRQHDCPRQGWFKRSSNVIITRSPDKINPGKANRA